jgi:hypothetical protein
VHIRIGLYGENQQFEIGELLINNGGYSVETVTGKRAADHERRIV